MTARLQIRDALWQRLGRPYKTNITSIVKAETLDPVVRVLTDTLTRKTGDLEPLVRGYLRDKEDYELTDENSNT